MGLGFCIHILKIHFLFFLTPHVLASQQVVTAPQCRRRSHTCGIHPGFFSMVWAKPTKLQPSPSELLLDMVFTPVKERWRQSMPHTEFTVVNPNAERIKGSRAAQYLAAKTASEVGGSVLFIQVHVFYRLVMDRRTSEKQIYFRSNSNDCLSFLEAPQFQQSVHQAMLQIFFFFFVFNFRGRRRSKKSAVLQLKCMDEVN